MKTCIKLAAAALMLGAARGAIDSADISSIIASHNAERSSPLTWDDTLATSATSWVDTCPSGHSTDDLRKGASENIGWGWPTITATEVSKKWIEEKKDLVNGICNAGAECGHYQIIVDPKMTTVGCATKQNCPSQGQPITQIWVCHYGQGAPSSNAPSHNSTSAAPSNSTSAAPNNSTSAAPNSSPAAPGVADPRLGRRPIQINPQGGYLKNESSESC